MNLRSVDLNLLVTFEAVLTERSVSAAAERLGVTQSAVSHALRRLRAVFHDQLLVRGPAGMEPTPRALQIADVVSEALGQIEQVISQQRGFDPGSSERSFTVRAAIRGGENRTGRCTPQHNLAIEKRHRDGAVDNLDGPCDRVP